MKRRQNKEKHHRKILLLQAEMLLIEAESGMSAEELTAGWEQILCNLEDPLFLYDLKNERIKHYHKIISDQLVILKKLPYVLEEPSFNAVRLTLIHSDLTRLLRP